MIRDFDLTPRKKEYMNRIEKKAHISVPFWKMESVIRFRI